MPTLIAPTTPDGPLVDVLVGLSHTEARRLRYGGQPVPPPARLKALLDTGAECTCADLTALSALTLPLKDVAFFNVPALGGTSIVSRHDASLTILHPSGNTREDWLLSDLPIADVALRTLGYEVLIGRDVLDLCTFVYEGRAGRFTLTY